MNDDLKQIKSLAGLNEDSLDDLHRFEDIIEEMIELTREAMSIVQRSDTANADRARAYWYGHIMSAIGSSEYSTHPGSMMSSLHELSEVYDEDDDEDDDFR